MAIAFELGTQEQPLSFPVTRTERTLRSLRPKRHLLAIDGIEEEGRVKLKIRCPAVQGEQCPDATDALFEAGHFVDDGSPDGRCLVQFELSQIGNEIIEGEADGPGPWTVVLHYAGSGEDAEGWITLTNEEV